MTVPEVELDQHAHATRNLSALLSAALAAAQSAAQVSAQRARATAQRADQQTRQAEQVTREQTRLAQQQAERQQRATQNVQHRQWSLKPTAQWLHDKPLSAAAAWASADVARVHDPVATRHAEQWETIFTQEGVDVAEVRAAAPAAVAVPDQDTPTHVPDVEGDLAAAVVAESAVAAGASDHIEAMRNDPALLAGMENHRNEFIRHDGGDVTALVAGLENHLTEFVKQAPVWTAYADGAPAAALGGRGVSTPPSQVLAKSRETPALAAATASDSARHLELINTPGVER